MVGAGVGFVGCIGTNWGWGMGHCCGRCAMTGLVSELPDSESGVSSVLLDCAWGAMMFSEKREGSRDEPRRSRKGSMVREEGRGVEEMEEKRRKVMGVEEGGEWSCNQ